MIKKFDDGNFLQSLSEGQTEFTPIQIIGMMIASAHTHYLEEHKKFLQKLHGVRDNPIMLTRMIENQLKLKYDAQSGDFQEPPKQSAMSV